MSFLNKLFDNKHRSRTISYVLVLAVYIICEGLMATGNMTTLFKNLLVPCACYIVAAISLNLCVGLSGELSLGHAGFMVVGAFTGVVISGFLAPVISVGLIRLVIAMVLGAAIAALLGYLIGIPVLKLQGDYLAIVTLAFGQIIKTIITNMYLGFDENGVQFSFVNNNINLAPGGKVLIGGPIGASGTDRVATFTMAVILVFIALVVVYNLMYSRNGRAIMATRDNRIAAQSVGIDVTKTKMLAFVVSAALAGAAGAVYGLNFSTLAATKFDYNISILILVYVVLGGLGNITGTIVATSVLYILPEMLRGLQDYRMIIYSLILIAIMLITNNAQIRVMFESLKAKVMPHKSDLKEGE